MGRPFGVPVYVAPSWFLVAALITWWFAPTVEAQVPGLGAWRYAVSFAFAVLLYLSVLVHELSHSVTALRLGLPVRRISLHLLGGVSEIGREPQSAGREFLIAFAGPAVSILLGVVGLGLMQVIPPGTVLGFLALELMIANFLVGGFNLLPGLPLDGGRLLAAGVWKVSGRRLTGITAAAWAGRLLAVVVLVAPVLLALAAGRQPSLVTVVWSALIASFMWFGAGQALASARVRDRLPRVSARALARRALPVSADLPLAEALSRMAAAQAHALVVVDGAGRPVGVVSEAAVRATPLERRPWIPAVDVSRRLDAGMSLPADLAGEGLITAMQQAPASEYLVVDEAGQGYGVLATADVERAVSRRGAARS